MDGRKQILLQYITLNPTAPYHIRFNKLNHTFNHALAHTAQHDNNMQNTTLHKRCHNVKSKASIRNKDSWCSLVKKKYCTNAQEASLNYITNIPL